MSIKTSDFIETIVVFFLIFGGVIVSIIKKIYEVIQKQNGKSPEHNTVHNKKAKLVKKKNVISTPQPTVYDTPVEYNSPAIIEEVTEDNNINVEQQQRPKRMTSRPRGKRPSIDLKKAMVMHEILKPPKGLSDDF